MLNLFRQNSFFAGILVVLLAALLRIPELVHPHPYEFISGAPFSSLLFGFMAGLPNPHLAALLANFIFVSGGALLLNFIVSRHDILYKNTFLPGLLFVVLNSLFPEQCEFTPQLISSLLIMLLFMRLCYVYESSNPLLLVFDSGMYLGLAMLFNYDVSIFLPYILISVVIFTSFNLRYLAVSLLGILLPLYFTVAVFYLTDNMQELTFYVSRSFEKTSLRPAISRYEYLAPFVMALLLGIAAFFNLQRNFFRNKVKTRRILQSTGLLFLFGVAGLFIENTNFIYALYYLNIPLAIALAYFFISDKRYLLKEALFLLLIMFSLYFQVM